MFRFYSAPISQCKTTLQFAFWFAIGFALTESSTNLLEAQLPPAPVSSNQAQPAQVSISPMKPDFPYKNTNEGPKEGLVDRPISFKVTIVNMSDNETKECAFVMVEKQNIIDVLQRVEARSKFDEMFDKCLILPVLAPKESKAFDMTLTPQRAGLLHPTLVKKPLASSGENLELLTTQVVNSLVHPG